MQVLKHVLSEALQDELFRHTLAMHLRNVLENENSKEGLVYLLQNVLDDERIKTKAKFFTRETIASDTVKLEAASLGKLVVEQIIADSYIQKKAGEGLWQAVGYSITPRWFTKDLNNETASSDEPAQDIKT